MRFAVLILSLFALSVNAQVEKLSFVTALDGDGRFVAGVSGDEIRVKGPAILRSAEMRDRALDVVVLLDVSASSEALVPAEIAVAREIISSKLDSKRDRVTIYKFSGKTGLVYGPGSDFEAALKSIASVKFEPPEGYLGGGQISGTGRFPNQSGNTSLWDAVSLAAPAPPGSDAGRRRVLIVLTDGVDTASDKKRSSAIAELIKARIPVFPIGIADRRYTNVDRGSLDRLAGRTGGVAVYPNGRSVVSEMLDPIISAARNYHDLVLSVSTEGDGGKLIEMKVSIQRKSETGKIRVYAPAGVY